MNTIKKFNNNEGVSLIALIITIIIIVILAAIAIMNFTETNVKASTAKILNEFIEVENAVGVLGKMHNMDANVHRYIGIALTDVGALIVNNKSYGDGYYLLKTDDLEKLGINSTSRDYIVNYNTGEVLVTEPYIINHKEVYTKAELITEETDSSVSGIAEYDEAKRVNKPVLLHGMLPVKYDNGEWVVCSVNDTEWYDYGVISSGPVRQANVMVMDDIELYDPQNNKTITNEIVRATNIQNLVGFQVVNPGSTFVWIPRYSYLDVDGNVQIMYSHLTQDYLGNGYVKSPSFYNGEYNGATPDNFNAGYKANGKELTGIWISKYQASYGN